MQLYFDNAATSFPKPPQVADAICEYLNKTGGSYGRSSSQRSFNVAMHIESLRDDLASIIGVSIPEKVVFAPSATLAINTVLFGYKWKTGKVLHSVLEHNSTMRPLQILEKRGLISLDVLPSEHDGKIDFNKLNCFSDDYDLIVVNHQSNVNGLVQPIEHLKTYFPESRILLDASQTIGEIGIHADEWGVDFVAFTGHKGLLGPTGTAGFYVKNPELLEPLIFGGTGSNSGSFEMPENCPVKFEAGTLNIAGLYGLAAAIENKPETKHTKQDFKSLIEELKQIEAIRVYCAQDFNNQGQVVSISTENLSELADKLLIDHHIESRTGLHCAPFAHQHLKTFPEGTIRFSFSYAHDKNDLDYLLDSIKKAVK